MLRKLLEDADLVSKLIEVMDDDPLQTSTIAVLSSVNKNLNRMMRKQLKLMFTMSYLRDMYKYTRHLIDKNIAIEMCARVKKYEDIAKINNYELKHKRAFIKKALSTFKSSNSL